MGEPSVRYIDDLGDGELHQAVVEAMDDQGFALAWKIAKRLRSRGFNISPQGLGGALRRHPDLVYDRNYATGRGRLAWRFRV